MEQMKFWLPYPPTCREKNRRAQARHRERNKVTVWSSSLLRQSESFLLFQAERRSINTFFIFISHDIPITKFLESNKGNFLQKAIEDLSAKNSALMSEVANLKLELAIMSKVSQAKDSHFSKMRRAKVDALSCLFPGFTFTYSFQRDESDTMVLPWSYFLPSSLSTQKSGKIRQTERNGSANVLS